MPGRICHPMLGRMLGPPLSRRLRHVPLLGRSQAALPRTSPAPPPARRPPPAWAAPPRRNPPAARRWGLGQRHRPPPGGPSPYHLRRPLGLPAVRAGCHPPAAPPRRPATLDPGPGRRHLAVGRDAPLRTRPALRALVPPQAPRLPPEPARPAGDQPRAPAPPAAKGGFALRRVQRKLTSADPRRRAILARIRACWRHRPRGGVL